MEILQNNLPDNTCVVILFQSRGPSKPDLLGDARRSHKSSKRGLENGINGKKRKSEKRRARVGTLGTCSLY